MKHAMHTFFTVSLGGALAACAADNTGGSGGGSASGGSSFGGLGGTGGEGGMGGSGMGGSGMGGSGMGGSGGDLCKTPTTLHPPKPDAGLDNIYCPFSATGGGKNEYCASGSEHCCEPKATGAVSKCQPLSQPCGLGDTDWQCQDPVADCPSGQKCCGAGTVVKNPDSQCANYATGFTGTKCATTCGAGEVEMCTADSECAAPQTCLPFGAKGAQVGACQ
ncbi:MAG: hypothetical protein AMXMBFR56_57720 [Polyangiaceae bacterium]